MQKLACIKPQETCVTVDPGICGFTCLIKASKTEARTVALEIAESECKQIQKLSEILNTITLKELFMPISRNPIFLSAQQANCHASCPIPLGAIKAVEVAFEMALPKDVRIKFVS